MDIKISDISAPVQEETVCDKLLPYTLSPLEDTNPKELGIYIDDENGNLIAGLVADTLGDWLEIHYLWIHEHERKSGIENRLLRRAEETALERGCKYAFLSTFHFTAPDFYLRHGYTEEYAVSKHPMTDMRYYYIKKLSD